MADELIREIKHAFVEEARSDTVGLWLLAKWVKEDLKSLTNEAAQRVTLQIIRDAMETGEVVAGDFAEKDRETLIFVPWSLSVDETVARIEREWMADKELNPGEIAWFVAPTLLPISAKKYPMGEHWQPKPARTLPDP
jgi:hypothetical protein